MSRAALMGAGRARGVRSQPINRGGADMSRLSITVRLTLTGIALAALSPLFPGVPAAGEILASAAWVCLIGAYAAARRARVPAVAPPAGAVWAEWPDVSDLVRPGALLLGLWPGSRAPLYLDEEQASAHALVLGPSGTDRKSTRR